MGRILKAIGSAIAELRGKKQERGISSDWVYPSVGNWARAFEEIGLRHNHGAMVGMAVQWVGICSAFNAVQCAGVPMRMYRKSGSRGMTGRWAGRAVKGRRRIDWLKSKSGRKSSQYAEQAGDLDEIVDHPILTLLNAPNPWMGGIEYHRRLYQAGELAGNFYEYRAEDASAMQLLPLAPQWTRVKPDANDLVVGYRYGIDESVMRTYPEESVMHHKHLPAPDNLWYGVGPLRHILAESNIFAMAIDYELNGMVNGIRPSEVVISVGEETQDPQMDQIRAYLQKWHRGPQKSGTPMLLRDAEATLLSRTAVDMEYREGMRDIRNMTLTCFGIPEQLLMRGEGGSLSESGSSQGKASENYAKLTVMPRIVAVNEMRNSRLFEWFGVEPGEMWLACDDPCPPSREDLREDAKVMVPIGVMTPNEAREALSLDPDPEGDTLRFAGKSMETMDRPPPEPQAQPGGKPKPKPGDKAAHPRKPNRAEQELEAAIPAGNLLAKGLRQWFTMIQPEVVEAVNFEKMSVVVELSKDARTAFFTMTAPGLEAATVAGYNVGAVELASKPILEVSQAAAKALRGYQGKMLTSVSDTTEKAVKAALSESLAAGENDAQALARVKEVLGPGSEVRADAIASTESARAFNMAREQAWIAEGHVETKEWLPSGDPCPICQTLSGQTRKVGKPFVNSGETITLENGDEFTNNWEPVYGPPAHPYCVLPDTKVSTCGLVAATRGRYSGNVVEVRTKSGRVVTVTKNHKLLSDRGFVSASSLAVGSNLVCGVRGDDTLDPDNGQSPPAISEVFAAIRVANNVRTSSVPASSEHFHGDGAGLVGEIQVVAANGLLWNGVDPSLFEKVMKHPLVGVHGASTFSGRSHATSLLLGLRLSAYGVVGSASKILAGLWSHAGESDLVGLASGAWNDPELQEPAADSASIDAHSSGNFEFGPAFGHVELDEVVEINVSSYSGHVYDLSTVAGVYLCNGIVGHNCRCGIGMGESE